MKNITPKNTPVDLTCKFDYRAAHVTRTNDFAHMINIFLLESRLAVLLLIPLAT